MGVVRVMFILVLVLVASVSILPVPLSTVVGVASVSAESSGLHLLEEIQTVITDLAERAKPSVVNIFPIQGSARSKDAPRERLPNSPGSGSGVIIDADGHIVTNNHVVGEASEVEVRLSDRTKYIAQVIGKDPDTDLAVLKVTSDRPLPSASFGDSSSVKVGQWVLAVGNPFGLDRTVPGPPVRGPGADSHGRARGRPDPATIGIAGAESA